MVPKWYMGLKGNTLRVYRELVWGDCSLLTAFAESVRNMLNYSLQYHYQLVVLPHRKSKENQQNP